MFVGTTNTHRLALKQLGRLRNELILPASSNLTVDGGANWATGCHARGAALAKVLAETAQER